MKEILSEVYSEACSMLRYRASSTLDPREKNFCRDLEIPGELTNSVTGWPEKSAFEPRKVSRVNSRALGNVRQSKAPDLAHAPEIVWHLLSFHEQIILHCRKNCNTIKAGKK